MKRNKTRSRKGKVKVVRVAKSKKINRTQHCPQHRKPKLGPYETILYFINIILINSPNEKAQKGKNNFKEPQILQALSLTGFYSTSLSQMLHEMTLTHPALLCLAPLSHETPPFPGSDVSCSRTLSCLMLAGSQVGLQKDERFISVVSWMISDLKGMTYI